MAPRSADRSRTPAEVWLLDGEGSQRLPDELATEEPLSIRLRAGGEVRDLAVTMRTPGQDAELAAGFLFCEGVITAVADLAAVETVEEAALGERPSAVVAALAAGRLPDLGALERHFFAASACGVCGRARLAAPALPWPPAPGVPRLDRRILSLLPERLHRAQAGFRATGGLHGAALFSREGVLIAAREDVGRHNALDKLVGWGLLAGRLPFAGAVVLVSGRASYEIVQKAAMAGASAVAAVSAPTSLAVALAREYRMTLVGFLRGRRMNVYSGADRLAPGMDTGEDRA